MVQSPRSWFDRVPKIELHLHLEGAIPHEALWTLIQKYGGDSTVRDFGALERRFVYRDFPHFIDTWVWQTRFVREYEDFTFIAEAVARSLAAQNIRYVEAFCSPSDFRKHGLAVPSIIAAIREGLARVPEIEIALVPDLVRDSSLQKAAQTLAEVYEVADRGVIGINIGGSEQLYPPEPFERIYEEARRMGLRTSVHAGEAAGASSVWGAVRILQTDRIGHGTRAVEDESLLSYLAEKRIPIELCPLSNVSTGVIATIHDHPVRRFFDLGMLLSINTDDPQMFGNSLADEYRMLAMHHGFSHAEIRALILQAIESSWLPLARKEQLARQFVADPDWQG